jgi:alpha-ketoglutarate-dependent taurine dioxygenase
MHQAVSVDQLLAAARSVTTTFEAIPADPVRLPRVSAIGPQASKRIVDRYARNGFAVMTLESAEATPETLLTLTNSLGLGEPFVPPLYSLGGNTAPVVSRISAAFNAGTTDENHPSFGSAAGQRLHCDGTLQRIGYVKASLLLCETPAAEGGDTTLFNASAAFAQLAAVDVRAAAALATPGVLVRQANINGSTDINSGPAFTVQDRHLVCRYCVTETDSWVVPDGVADADVHRGVGFLLHAALPGSPHFRQLRLEAGQAIVFDNTRISHGRTSYRDSDTRRRSLYRSLHLRHPRARVLEPADPGSDRVEVLRG